MVEASPPDTGRAGASPMRVVAANAASLIERFDDPTLLLEGKINIIALDAVVEKFGARWAMRCDQVYDYVERTLQRHLGVDGFFARVSETDFLICQPNLGRFSAQAACVRYLRDILGHFLGAAHLADASVLAVTQISAAGIEASAIDVKHAEQAEGREIAERQKTDPERHVVDQWSPFISADGRSIRVSCRLEPVYELKAYGRIGFRLVRRVLMTTTEEELTPAAIANLAGADIARIDMATIARGLDRLMSDAPDERHPSVIIPVSYASLSSQRGRAELIAAFKSARALVERGVICEIGDIEGVPQGALTAVVALIRPFSLFTIGRLSNAAPHTIALLKDTGLQALAVECPPGQDPAVYPDWAKTVITAAKKVARSVLIYGADSAGSAGLAGILGATHASIRVL